MADTGREQEAEHWLRRSLELAPSYGQAAYNLSSILFQQGRYYEAWPYYEARHDPFLPRAVPPPPSRLGPAWQGEPLQGKSILVWPEQGLGDLIHFSRYVPLLKQAGAAAVTLVTHNELQPLLATLDGIDRCLPLADAASLEAHDYCVLALSLPYRFRDQQREPLAALPYLRARPQHLALWQGKLGERGKGIRLRIGLVWRGNPLHVNDNERSLASLEILAPLWELAGVEWFSLQKNADPASIPSALPLRQLGEELQDFADTAAALSAMDMLVSVDTSAAHVAGALGLPTHVLLPAYKADWRWGKQGQTSTWYPGVMRLYRQPLRGDWATPVAALKRELERLLQERA
jgi:hypothetical protein